MHSLLAQFELPSDDSEMLQAALQSNQLKLASFTIGRSPFLLHYLFSGYSQDLDSVQEQLAEEQQKRKALQEEIAKSSADVAVLRNQLEESQALWKSEKQSLEATVNQLKEQTTTPEPSNSEGESDALNRITSLQERLADEVAQLKASQEKCTMLETVSVDLRSQVEALQASAGASNVSNELEAELKKEKASVNKLKIAYMKIRDELAAVKQAPAPSADTKELDSLREELEEAKDRKSTRLNSSHRNTSRMPSSA